MTIHYKYMQHEDKKFIQHKIQYTVAQCRVGVEVSRERKDQKNKNLKKEGVTWYLCYYVSTTVLYVSNIT